MKTAVIVLLSALLSTIVFTSGERLNDFISHYEGLRYSTETLQAKHERVKRAAMGEATPEDVHLAFFAHGRDFHLQLSPDNSMFSKDFQLETSDGVQQIDLSHIYSGYLAGEPGTTMCHGSIINGRFEGFIYTPQGDYYIEPAERYNTSADVHSVIYKAEHVEDPLPGHKTGCGVHGDYTLHEPKSVFPPEEVDDNEVNDHEYNKYADPHKRYRRQTVPTKNTCQIYIMADHKFYAYYGTWEAAVAQLAAHVKAVNAIYRPLVLDDKTGYGVEVTRIRINTTEDALQTDNPFRPDNIGAEAYLDLLSNYNHNPYCLAYGFTDRDFEGTLGLAWVGSICSRYLSYSGRYQSRNTGLVSVQLYGNHVPPKVSHITFAHEVGHSWGSPHDPEGACSPGGEFGNYIMFAQATSGDKNNNNKFSSCSLDSIRRTVGSRSQRCYRPADSAICGNGIVEEGEQCDCGYQDQCDRMGDVCCNGQFQEGSPIACTLKQGAICSPSQGTCCNTTCTYNPSSFQCADERECAHTSYCSGVSSSCPDPAPKPDLTTMCSEGTRVCLDGQCSESVCRRYGYDRCECKRNSDGTNEEELCHVCCQQQGQPETCRSSKYFPEFNAESPLTLEPGSVCDDNKGYCDNLNRCREVDIDGPLARIKKLVLYGASDWAKDNWWSFLLLSVGIIMLVVGVTCCLNAVIPSSIEEAKAERAGLR
ncbi:disintegrin and metalloproteinase domain-containing protein 10-like isoform X2 [Branchiostoma floridae]|uniref:ADAM10 endopeptidase n=1 Tax=Branchiostoma floridae TaxID=7739 RepID=A0A9J7KS49_BRAFL|nr:disintegrin and metalloproteinase domain-containing protein 10-like isoform X2 [Branchiostoma floridae]